jgi:hypothetical protein
MKVGLLSSAILIVLTGTIPSVRAAEDWTMYLRRAGPVRIGMSLDEVRRVLGDPRAELKGDDECAYLQSKALPKGLGFMFAKRRIVRIDVSDGDVRTATGARIGDSEDKIKKLYPGRITIEPHHYFENGHYLDYSPSSTIERLYGMVFETDGETVTSFRTGTLAAIALVEGCL